MKPSHSPHSCVRRACWLVTVLALCGGAPAAFAAGTVLVQFDPTGAQVSSTALAPISVAPRVTASDLSETGLITGYTNTGVLPVGLISASTTIPLGEYLSFSMAVASGFAVHFTDLLYDKVSYLGSGATRAAVRTSLDGFAANVATLSSSAAGIESLDFALSSLPSTTGSVQFRIYFYAAPSDRADWDDLLSSERGYNGLRLVGEITPVPELPTSSLLALGLAALAARAATTRGRGSHGRADAPGAA